MNRIKELRVEKRWSQARLGQELKCTGITISRYETGQRDIDSATICRLCNIFGCSADYLLGRSTLPTSELTPEEEGLLLAFRRSDERARDLVVVALAPFAPTESGESAI